LAAFRPGSGSGAQSPVRARIKFALGEWLEDPVVAQVSLVLAAFIAFFAVMGSLFAKTDAFPAFNLEGEVSESFRAPPLFSGALLFAAGSLALGAARVSTKRLAWLGIAGVFVYMGVDEMLGIHEHLERATAVDWQVLMAPVVLAAALLWASILRAPWPRPAGRILWVAGAGCWTASQILEPLEWSGDRMTALGGELMVAEEVLEMIGSALFLLAILLFLRARQRDDPPTVGDDRPPGSARGARLVGARAAHEGSSSKF
jgi:hypothetical protein